MKIIKLIGHQKTDIQLTCLKVSMSILNPKMKILFCIKIMNPIFRTFRYCNIFMTPKHKPYIRAKYKCEVKKKKKI